MRTLQEKYNAIQEGKFSKEHFLAEARMQQPQLITRFNGYDDAVKILKNRGMIQETYSTEESFKDYSDDALTDMIINSSRFEGNEEVIARIKQELARRKEGMQEEVDTTTRYDVTLRNGKHFSGVKFINRNSFNTANGGTYLNQEIDRVTPTDEKLRETVKEARLTKKNLTDYRYKPTNEMDKYPYEQILRGLRVELEGLGVQSTPTADEYKKALGKVLKNLEKDEIYYTNQVAGNNKKVDLHDKMVDATAKNTVDTFNGLKKAELKEGFKKLIKKVLSENIEEDVYEMYADEEEDELDDSRGLFKGFRDDEDDEIDYDDENFSDPFIDGEEEDDISHPRGYEEASDEETFDDLFKENKSEKELRAEWEKYQATCHPEDKMSYIEWRSEQGIDESVSLKDLL
jgi:hypothetical protein